MEILSREIRGQILSRSTILHPGNVYISYSSFVDSFFFTGVFSIAKLQNMYLLSAVVVRTHFFNKLDKLLMCNIMHICTTCSLLWYCSVNFFIFYVDFLHHAHQLSFHHHAHQLSVETAAPTTSSCHQFQSRSYHSIKCKSCFLCVRGSGYGDCCSN